MRRDLEWPVRMYPYRPIEQPHYNKIEVPSEITLMGMCFGIAGIMIQILTGIYLGWL